MILLELLTKIIKEEKIEYFGVINYDKIEPYLLKNYRSIKLIPSNAKSIISMLFPYKVRINKKNISLYACVKDYHIIVGEILKRICDKLKKEFKEQIFVPFVDSSPIPEVYVAAMCGLGVIGDNKLLINDKYGSFVFIGEIVTDLEFLKSNTKAEIIEPKTCLHCGRCKETCPGKALDKKLDIDRCASHLSQKKGILSEEEKLIINKSDSIWGCDICQEVCPLNKESKFTYIDEFKDSVLSIIDLNNYKERDDRAFLWRPSKVIARNIEINLGTEQLVDP